MDFPSYPDLRLAGYLTPPVGISLFLASQRFRASLPFLLIMLIWLALVTYLPGLSRWWKKT